MNGNGKEHKRLQSKTLGRKLRGRGSLGPNTKEGGEKKEP